MLSPKWGDSISLFPSSVRIFEEEWTARFSETEEERLQENGVF